MSRVKISVGDTVHWFRDFNKFRIESGNIIEPMEDYGVIIKVEIDTDYFSHQKMYWAVWKSDDFSYKKQSFTKYRHLKKISKEEFRKECGISSEEILDNIMIEEL